MSLKDELKARDNTIEELRQKIGQEPRQFGQEQSSLADMDDVQMQDVSHTSPEKESLDTDDNLL